ncbi:MAG: hydrolase [Candidatus Polarisedimenticolaceae bacterium]|nr:hydrolase [Candidatus Polarisedimenticolaceae bacterium]
MLNHHSTYPSTFKPAWWLNNCHLQTLYPALLRKSPPLTLLKRERLTTPDSDFIDIDWCSDGEGPLVILLHGLTGSSQSCYILGLQHRLLKEGVSSVVLNFRGCSGEPNRLARGYHSGETGDIDFLYRTLRLREPERPMAAIGFSLGGNVLLKWLGEQGDNISLDAAISVSAPLVLADCATKLDQGFSKLYRRNLIHDLVNYIEEKGHHLARVGQHQEARKIQQLGDLSAIKSFWQYDDQVVAKLHGFKDAKHYYRLSSSRQYLHKIVIPTLILHAIDDPFMTESILPRPDELSATLLVEVTSGGGHVGFISGNNPFKPHYWLEPRISEFLQGTLLT